MNPDFGTLGYATAAGLFAVLTVLLLTSWRGRLQGGLLVLASLVSAIWAGWAAYAGIRGGPVGAFQLVLESARSGAWFLFLFGLLAPLKGTDTTHPRLFRYGPALALAIPATVLLVDLWPVERSGWVSPQAAASVSLLGHLGLALIGLSLIEQLYRNTRPDQRWGIKYLFFGLGGLFAYDFYLYADALLFRHVDPNLWQARGFVNALCVPLLAIAAVRNPVWSVRIFVSRQVVFHATTVVGAGLYLLIMAGAGYYIRVYGGTWGAVAQAAFLFLAMVLLAGLLFSGSVRTRLRVFLNKHFYANKYDYRQEWLRFFDTLTSGGPGQQVRENCVRALANIVDSRGGLLWQHRAQGGYHCVAAWNLSMPGGPLPEDDSLVRFLTQTGYLINLAETEHHPEEYAGLELPGWVADYPSAWLVLPLWREQALYGFAVLATPPARRGINWEDRDLLLTAGRQVASYLALVEASEALAESRQFEAFNRLSAYLVHDLKNVVAQLDLVVSNAERHGDNPAFVADAFKTVANASAKMRRMLEQLRQPRRDPGSAERVDLKALLAEVTAERAAQRPAPSLDAEPVPPVLAERERLGAVFAHLIQNAQEATPDTGHVWVRLRAQQDQAVVEIEDDGHGMDEAFINERLFRPFDTTKGNAGMGIGVYESREFIRALGGHIEVHSRPAQGTRFTLHLPLKP